MTESMAQADVERSCIAYKWLGPGGYSDEFEWRYVDCNIKAGFICGPNPDFLGYFQLKNVRGSIWRDLVDPQMSLTSCLADCSARQKDQTLGVTMVLKDRCICYAQPATHHKPYFLIKNVKLNKCMAASTSPLPQDCTVTKKPNVMNVWKFDGPTITSLNPYHLKQSLEFDFSGKISLKHTDHGNKRQHLVYTEKNELLFTHYGLYIHLASANYSGFVAASEKDYGGNEWILEPVAAEETKSEFIRGDDFEVAQPGTPPRTCRETIRCGEDHQSCGCSPGFGQGEDLAIAYQVGKSSHYHEDLRFKNCLDVHANGIKIPGAFLNEDGDVFYCRGFWSKC